MVRSIVIITVTSVGEKCISTTSDDDVMVSSLDLFAAVPLVLVVAVMSVADVSMCSYYDWVVGVVVAVVTTK